MTPLATELAAEPAAEVALPAALVGEELPLREELPLLEDELPLLEPEELEPEELELPVLEALEPEEVPELLPPVMLLRTEPVLLSVWFVLVVGELVVVLLGAAVALEMMEPLIEELANGRDGSF